MAASIFQVDERLALYWKNKAENSEFHSNSWGGFRGSRYSGVDEKQLHSLIWMVITTQEQITLQEIVNALERHNFHYSRSWVSRLLKRWRWSFKIPAVTQTQKYTISNLEYYAEFCLWLNEVDLAKVKFLDEVHFDARSKFI